jgi:hypothetical protein
MEELSSKGGCIKACLKSILFVCLELGMMVISCMSFMSFVLFCLWVSGGSLVLKFDRCLLMEPLNPVVTVMRGFIFNLMGPSVCACALYLFYFHVVLISDLCELYGV